MAALGRLGADGLRRWEETVSQAPYQPHNNQPSFQSFCGQGPEASFLFTPPKMCCPAIFKVTAAQTAPPLHSDYLLPERF